MTNYEMDKYNGRIRANTINLSTLVNSFIRNKVFRCSVGYNLLSSGIVLNLLFPILIFIVSCMMTNLVMITLSIEDKSTLQLSDLIVVNLKILPWLNIWKILDKSITAASN